jgi:glycosyltransferase involved in cell wall biosynthesis
MKRFSVVIPAYNESKTIVHAIASLKRQNVPREAFEIIAVDNNSTDDTAVAAHRAGADKVVAEHEKGTNFARQRGFLVSEGKIVAFLDADSTVPHDWLMRIEMSLLKPGVAAVSGPYDYGFRGLRLWVDKLFQNILFAHLAEILKFLFHRRGGVIIGGNFAAWRWAIEKIGGLPPLRFWGDDAAIAMLIARKAGRVFFNPGLRVKSSPRRFKEEGFFSLEIRYIRAYFKVYFSKEWE